MTEKKKAAATTAPAAAPKKRGRKPGSKNKKKATSAKKTSGTTMLTLNKIKKLVGDKGTAKIEVTTDWVDVATALKGSPDLLKKIQKYA